MSNDRWYFFNNAKRTDQSVQPEAGLQSKLTLGIRDAGLSRRFCPISINVRILVLEKRPITMQG